MSRLLIHDYPLMVSPRLAQAVGLNEAIFLQQLHYWLGTSGKERGGRQWVYNTLTEWNAQFPFWGLNTVRRTIDNLEKRGLVDSTDEFNVIKSDRTKWYTVNYPAVEALDMGLLESTGHLPKMGRPSAQNGQVLASAQNGQVIPETQRQLAKTNKPIEAVELPDWLPDEAWGDFLAYRKGIKAPVTELSAKRLLATLEKLRSEGHDPVQVIDQTIATEKWTGLFPLKDSRPASARRPQTQAEANQRFVDGMEETRAAVKGIFDE